MRPEDLRSAWEYARARMLPELAEGRLMRVALFDPLPLSYKTLDPDEAVRSITIRYAEFKAEPVRGPARDRHFLFYGRLSDENEWTFMDHMEDTR